MESTGADGGAPGRTEPIYAGYWDVGTADPNSGSDEVVAALTAAGYDVATHQYPQTRQYSREQWIDFAFTHSNYLTLSEERADELRAEVVGADRAGRRVGVWEFADHRGQPKAYTQYGTRARYCRMANAVTVQPTMVNTMTTTQCRSSWSAPSSGARTMST